MTVIDTTEGLYALLGLTPTAPQATVQAAIRAAVMNGSESSEAAVEAEVDRHLFPELVSASAPTSTAPTAPSGGSSDDAIEATMDAHFFPDLVASRFSKPGD